jgi:hypothetical protein
LISEVNHILQKALAALLLPIKRESSCEPATGKVISNVEKGIKNSIDMHSLHSVAASLFAPYMGLSLLTMIYPECIIRSKSPIKHLLANKKEYQELARHIILVSLFLPRLKQYDLV